MWASCCSTRVWRQNDPLPENIQLLALWQAQATSGGNSPEESSVRAQMLCQGGLGQFCNTHQKGALFYIYEAKASGAWRSQASQGTLMSL